MAKNILITFAFLSLTTFYGCTHQAGQPQPRLEVPAEFTQSGTEPLPDKWWQSLNDPQLNELIEQALNDSFTLKSAWDRLSQAELAAIKTGSYILPAATYSAGYDRSRVETNSTTTYQSEYSAALVLSYELDLWGKIRSDRQAALEDVEVSRNSLCTAALTLSSAIAKTYFQLAETQVQNQVLNAQLKANQDYLQIIELQFSQGLVWAPDILRQRQLIESTQGKIIQNHQQNILLQHQLAILIGQPPASYWNDTDFFLAALGSLPEVTPPSVLLQRRPDVLQALHNVRAADYRAASALADRYPTISLSASGRTSAERISDLFDDWAANLAAGIAGPLFDAGLRDAEAKRRQALLSETINNYSQTVLTALGEVEDALTREKYQRDYLVNLHKQLDLSNQTLERTRERYISGQTDYLRVLDALISSQTLQLTEVSARRGLIENRIDLCKSLAGAWQMKKPDKQIANF